MYTKEEVVNLLSQAFCDDLGINANYIDTSEHSCETWLDNEGKI